MISFLRLAAFVPAAVILVASAGPAEAVLVEAEISSPSSIIDNGGLLGLGFDEPFTITFVYDSDSADQNPSPGFGEYPGSIRSATLWIGPHAIAFDAADLELVVANFGAPEFVEFQSIDSGPVDAEFIAGPLAGTTTSTPDGSPFGFEMRVDYTSSQPLTSDAPPVPLPPLAGFEDAFYPLLQLEIDGELFFLQGQIPSAQVLSQVIEPVPTSRGWSLGLLAAGFLLALGIVVRWIA